MKGIGINRIPLVASANGIVDTAAADDVAKKLRQEFGDSFTRAELHHLLTVRTKHYASGSQQAPGARKLLDLVIDTLAGKEAGSRTESLPQTSVSTTTVTASTPPAEATPEESGPATVTGRARSVLDALGHTPVAKPKPGKSELVESGPAKLSLDQYAKPPTIIQIENPIDRSEERVRILQADWSTDGKTLRWIKFPYTQPTFPDAPCFDYFDREPEDRRGTLCELDCERGEVVREVRLESPEGYVGQGLAPRRISADGTRIMKAQIADDSGEVTGKESAAIYSWDAATGKPLPTGQVKLLADEQNVWWHASFVEPDASRLWTVDSKGRVRSRGCNGEEPVTWYTVPERAVRCGATFSPSGRLLALSSDPEDKEARHDFYLLARDRDGVKKVELEGSEDLWKGGAEFTFSPGEGFLVGVSERRRDIISIWDTKTGARREVRTGFPEYARAYTALTADGRVLAVATGGDVQLFDVQSGQKLGAPIPLQLDRALSFSPDGSRLLVGSRDARYVNDPSLHAHIVDFAHSPTAGEPEDG